ncbi:MAG: hypothetical protein L3J01_05330 [Thiomicrorhabdus sp.]|nr:hypothetical protein [Thiomicrorhabdus sp.]
MKYILPLALLFAVALSGCGNFSSPSKLPALRHPKDGELIEIFEKLDAHPSISMERIGWSFKSDTKSDTIRLSSENINGAGLVGYLIKNKIGESINMNFMLSYELKDGAWKFQHVSFIRDDEGGNLNFDEALNKEYISYVSEIYKDAL